MGMNRDPQNSEESDATQRTLLGADGGQLSEEEMTWLLERVLREQFGRALTDTVQDTLLVALPNLPYAICVTQLRDAGEVIVSIATVVGRIDWTTPGVTDVLLRDNNNLMLARFVREDEMLKVDYEVLAAATTAEGLAGGVKAVASAAVWGHATMLAAGALVLTEEIL
jgi:hypothetical protein